MKNILVPIFAHYFYGLQLSWVILGDFTRTAFLVLINILF